VHQDTMKPTFQFSRQSQRAESQRPQAAPVSKSAAIDWAYQSGADLRAATATSKLGSDLRPSVRGLYALTQGFFEEQTKWEDRIEGVALSVVIALAAWPILQAVHIAFRTV